MNAYEVIMIVLGILTVVISFGALIVLIIRGIRLIYNALLMSRYILS